MKHLQKAIFLDRDGTLNFDAGYTYKIEDLKLLAGVKEGLTRLKKQGFLLILITNQSGIGRGYYRLEDCEDFIHAMEKIIGFPFNGVYICPHTPDDGCLCRKPEITHILKAQKRFSIDLDASYFVGDSECDMLCGKNAGCTSIFIGEGKAPLSTKYAYTTLLEFSSTLC